MKLFSILLLAICFCLCLPQFGLAQKAEKKALQRARRAARSMSLLAANGGGTLIRPDLDDALGNEQLLEWVRRNKDALVGAQANPFSNPSRWGVATTNGSNLYLHITAWPKKNRKLLLPRLQNSVLSVRFTDQDKQLKLTPNVNEWEIALPDNRQRNSFLSVIELQLDRPIQLGKKTPPVVKPDEDKSIHLHARYAVTRGQLLRFEPQPHKNTIGYWTKEDDWAEWAFEAGKGQTYEVFLRYGCGDGQGGSDIEIAIGEQKIPFVVEATGGFQAWKDVSLGEVSGLDGSTKLSVQAIEKAKAAVMDIQEITLKPR